MKTKQKKTEELEKGKTLLADSNALLFTNLTGLPAENLRKLRRAMSEKGVSFFVLKKRLLGLALKEKGIDVSPKEKFSASVGTAFSKLPIEEVSAIAHKFLKGMGSKKSEEMLGGYDLETKEYLTGEEVRALGQLPPREILVGQVMGGMIAPLRAFLYILSEKSKKEA
jgi:large subunit ribosomal protein L10